MSCRDDLRFNWRLVDGGNIIAECNLDVCGIEDWTVGEMSLGDRRLDVIALLRRLADRLEDEIKYRKRGD